MLSEFLVLIKLYVNNGADVWRRVMEHSQLTLIRLSVLISINYSVHLRNKFDRIMYFLAYFHTLC